MNRPPRLRPGALVLAAVILGCTALAARPAELTAVVIVTGTIGILGLVAPLPATPGRRLAGTRTATRWFASVAIGVGVLAIARGLQQPAPVARFAFPLLAVLAVASVAEEAFFRRLVYGWLAPWSHAAAVGAAAAAFAAVHLPAYGAGALPLNLAAGLLLGWQRWATGGWSAPALTHMAANFLQSQ
jgi:membrane protease YdiL (CAAX protease family)